VTGLRSAVLRSIWALAMREFVRAAREPARIVAAVFTALLLWLVAGSGLASSFAPPGAPTTNSALSYGQYALPGVVLMVVMFATVLASITLIQDRDEGFLQAVLVSPTPRWAVASAKIVAGAVLATVQGALLLPGAWFIGLSPDAWGALQALAAALAGSIIAVSVGVALAWRTRSVASFHSVMNVVLLPMWALSGAVFPLDGAAGWLRTIMLINPLTWACETLGAGLGARQAIEWWMPGALALAAAAAWILAARSFRGRRGGA
jgi:ABC-2 type transport system permease protein